MSTPTPHVKEPIIDTPVFTNDGEQFGSVSEVQGGSKSMSPWPRITG